MIARRLMERLGVQRTVALVFVLAAIWTGGLAAVAMWTESVLFQALFVAVALITGPQATARVHAGQSTNV